MDVVQCTKSHPVIETITFSKHLPMVSYDTIEPTPVKLKKYVLVAISCKEGRLYVRQSDGETHQDSQWRRVDGVQSTTVIRQRRLVRSTFCQTWTSGTISKPVHLDSLYYIGRCILGSQGRIVYRGLAVRTSVRRGDQVYIPGFPMAQDRQHAKHTCQTTMHVSQTRRRTRFSNCAG